MPDGDVAMQVPKFADILSPMGRENDINQSVFGGNPGEFCH
jgi:hypothetical protein